MSAPEPQLGHIDGAAIAAVTDLYREVLPTGGAILDVMSGWVPHLPPEAPYRRVVGIGIEQRALVENPFLDEWRLQDLNRNPILPFHIEASRFWTAKSWDRHQIPRPGSDVAIAIGAPIDVEATDDETVERARGELERTLARLETQASEMLA